MADMMSMMTPAAAAPAPKKATKKKATKKKATTKKKAAPKKKAAKKATTKEEINAAIKAAADGPLKGILGYTDHPNVSSDFNHDARSSVFHNDQTKVMEGKFVSVLSWYDNEWGFSNRMLDTTVALMNAK